MRENCTSVPAIVAALLGAGANPVALDAHGRAPEQLARHGVWDRADEVIALLRRPRPLPRAVWEPLLREAIGARRPDVEIRIGGLTLRPYRREAGRVTAAVEMAIGQLASMGFDVTFSLAALARFRDDLAALVRRSFGRAVLESPDGHGVRLEVRDDGDGRFTARWSARTAGGPPGVGDGRPPRGDLALDPAPLEILARAAARACAELAPA